MKLIDLTGESFGKWSVIERVQTSRSQTIWRCKCECGTIKNVYATHLKRGNSKSCGRCSKKRGKDHPQWTGHGDICGDFWDSIKRGASGRKGRRLPVPFEITIQDAWDLFVAQNKKCVLTGLPIFIDYKGYNVEHTASLDRIDNSFGYIKNNIQWVHKDINMMKRTYDQDYFIKMCNAVSGLHKCV